MKPVIFFLACMFCFAVSINAQTYNITYSGNKVMTNNSPTKTAVSGSTTIEVEIDGTDITVTMGDSGAGLWSAHIMKGQTGNGKFVAVLKNGEKSVYTIRGSIKGSKISGQFIYFRQGDPSTGIVPGWTAVKFKS